MAIQITSALATRLRDEMREPPLHDGEIRRLVGLGRHHIARASTDIAAQGFARLYSLTIEVCRPWCACLMQTWQSRDWTYKYRIRTGI